MLWRYFRAIWRTHILNLLKLQGALLFLLQPAKFHQVVALCMVLLISKQHTTASQRPKIRRDVSHRCRSKNTTSPPRGPDCGAVLSSLDTERLIQRVVLSCHISLSYSCSKSLGSAEQKRYECKKLRNSRATSPNSPKKPQITLKFLQDPPQIPNLSQNPPRTPQKIPQPPKIPKSFQQSLNPPRKSPQDPHKIL